MLRCEVTARERCLSTEFCRDRPFASSETTAEGRELQSTPGPRHAVQSCRAGFAHGKLVHNGTFSLPALSNTTQGRALPFSTRPPAVSCCSPRIFFCPFFFLFLGSSQGHLSDHLAPTLEPQQLPFAASGREPPHHAQRGLAPSVSAGLTCALFALAHRAPGPWPGSPLRGMHLPLLLLTLTGHIPGISA